MISKLDLFISDCIDIHRWIPEGGHSLYLYGESAGVIWDAALNSTGGLDTLYVAGTFDTVSSASQSKYCSVAAWSGKYSKVNDHGHESTPITYSLCQIGEGLCPVSGESSSVVRINTIVMGGG